MARAELEIDTTECAELVRAIRAAVERERWSAGKVLEFNSRFSHLSALGVLIEFDLEGDRQIARPSPECLALLERFQVAATPALTGRDRNGDA